ncbi:unknown [Parabacteroides sp. CAG:409]|nr:unknown [Parabacteroides sp. CAG:409]
MHGRSTFSLEEFKLDFLLHRNTQLVNFTNGWLRNPKRNNIIELSAHRRNETGLIVFSTCQQSIGKSFLADFIFNDISCFQTTQFQHNLTGAPINSTGRSRIITSLSNINIDYITISSVDCCLLEFSKGSQRIIIVFDNMVGHTTGWCLYFKLTINSK